MKILVLNGPNINMLGIREPEIYGKDTYNDLCNLINSNCNKNHIEVDIYQSNHEGDLIDIIQGSINKYDGIVINAGGYTHTSVAIHDALKAVNIKTIEVHISKVNEREDYRQVNFITPCCIKTIIGKGIHGYIEAIEELVKIIK